jgi:hypothetical protein
VSYPVRGVQPRREEKDMMKKLIELAGEVFGRGSEAVKEIQYRYVFVPPVCGAAFSAVCVG